MGFKLGEIKMNKIKVIKTEQDYKDALELVEKLMSLDPDPESDEGEQLALLATLIEDYEERMFPETFPDPLSAIKFRMEQAGLKQSDLIPYIGSRSRVSEVLSGKRPLTLDMVRRLESGLGIPAKVLIQKPELSDDLQYQYWDTNLVRTMEKRGYFGDMSLAKYSKEDILTRFFSMGKNAQPLALFRKTNYRSSPLTDKNALTAWMMRVVEKSKKTQVPVHYTHGIIDLDFMHVLVQLSAKEKSPLLAQEHLISHGINLVIEPHLPKTYLDGAVILKKNENPIIGLTLRHDRLDSFWFTLMHELAHIALHYDQDIDLFYDEKLQDKDGIKIDTKEVEADKLAEESILPKAKWEISPARLIPSSMAAASLARELGVHIAIIAGQIRYKGGKYMYLNKIVNDAKVRHHFPNERWVE